MSGGKLGGGVSVSNTDVLLYEVPGSVEFATCDLSVVNASGADASLSVYITTSASPGVGDLIEKDTIVPMNGLYLRSCLCLSANERVMIRSDANDLVAQVRGIEKI